MRIRRVIGTLVVVLAALMLASPAAAQDPQPVTVGAGLTFFRFNDCEDCTEFGIRAEVSKVFRQMPNGGLALAGELGWTDSDFGSTVTVAAGPRYVIDLNGSAQPYVHVLVGLARYTFEIFDAANNLLIAPGGGVAFPINDRIGGFGQIDFPIIKGDGFTDTGQRFTFGVIFVLGQ